MIKKIATAAPDPDDGDNKDTKSTASRFAEGADESAKVAAEAKAADKAREDIGKPMVFTDSSGVDHVLYEFSWERRALWNDLRYIGAIGAPTVQKNAAVLIWLCLHDHAVIRPLTYKTRSSPGVYHPVTFDELLPPEIISCPLLDEITEWSNREFTDRETRMRAIDLSSEIIDRMNSAEMVPEDSEDAEADEDAQPGKQALDSDGITESPLGDSDTKKPKSDGESESTEE